MDMCDFFVGTIGGFGLALFIGMVSFTSAKDQCEKTNRVPSCISIFVPEITTN